MRLLSSLLLCVFIFSCRSTETPPDVSHIKVNLTTHRFEKALFGIDSAVMAQKLDSLIIRNGNFGMIFMTEILNADPRWSDDTINMYVGSFIKSYKPLYIKTQHLFNDFNKYEKEIRHALQYVKHYFAGYFGSNKKYQLPEKIITYIGPIDGYGDNLIPGEAFVIGLHHHLGAADTLYQSEMLNQTYPQYITKRFEPATIVVNAMTRLLQDMYPQKYEDETLINQMVENGKRYYVLQQLLPEVKPELLIGYSKDQFQFCRNNERQLWDFFIQNDLLQTKETGLIRNYLGDGPMTQEFGPQSPANIGGYIGWKIVEKYMQAQPELALDKLMETTGDEIVSKAKYKP